MLRDPEDLSSDEDDSPYYDDDDADTNWNDFDF